ncbi:YjcZ family sporulation protein [Paenibacillus sp. D51F]
MTAALVLFILLVIITSSFCF